LEIKKRSAYKPNSVSRWDNGYSSGQIFTSLIMQTTCIYTRGLRYTSCSCSWRGLPGWFSRL